MMSVLVVLVVLCLAQQALAFKPMMTSSSATMRATKARQGKSELQMSVFDKAVQDWAKNYPVPYKLGWGPTTKAERWNGRHAMFGWVALLATGYAKSHGLIPNPDSLLDLKEWGTLAYTYGGAITNERAVILIGHVHLLFFSVFAAVAPISVQDKLYLEEDEKHEPAAGLIPALVPGLTRQAELLNGRLAMLGLVVTIMISAVYQMPVLDVINKGLGGMLL